MKYKLYDAVHCDMGAPLVPFTLVGEFDLLEDVIIYIRQMDPKIKRQYYFVCDENSNPKFFIETEETSINISTI